MFRYTGGGSIFIRKMILQLVAGHLNWTLELDTA
jgi:hypothetical protein